MNPIEKKYFNISNFHFLLAALILQGCCQQRYKDNVNSEVVQYSDAGRICRYSVAELELRASQGDANAAYVLSNHLSFIDHDRSVKWRKRAADLGNAEARFSHGNLNYSASKSTKQRQEAIRYLKLSARQGNKSAIRFLEYIEKDKFAE